MAISSRAVFVASVVVPCVIFDQITKLIATWHLPPGRVYSFLGDLFRLQYAENTGAFLSLGSSLPEPWRQLIFTMIVGVFVVGLVVYILLSPAVTGRALWALTLVAAGGIGNLIDRVMNDGRVVDFLNVGIGWLRTGIFNIADMAITAGALILLWESFQPASSRQTASE